jgi:hypothetical protein
MESQQLSSDTVIARTAEKYLGALAQQTTSVVGVDDVSLTPEILKLLRCPYLSAEGVAHFDVMEESTEDIDALRKYLPRILQGMVFQQDDRFGYTSILIGLALHDCLPNGPKDEETAYALATAIVHYVEDYLPTYDMDLIGEPYVCALLNTWLKPGIPWAAAPGLTEVCRLLFGDAWCALSLPANCEMPNWAFRRKEMPVVAIVESARPQFLPGLCLSQVNHAELLPDDLGPTA